MSRIILCSEVRKSCSVHFRIFYTVIFLWGFFYFSFFSNGPLKNEEFSHRFIWVIDPNGPGSNDNKQVLLTHYISRFSLRFSLVLYSGTPFFRGLTYLQGIQWPYSKPSNKIGTKMRILSLRIYGMIFIINL